MPSNRGLTDRAYRERRARLLAACPVCYLCGKPIDLNLSGRHPMGPHIEHVHARANGGQVAAHNERPAHNRCNAKKGTNPAPPQPVRSRRW